MSVTVPALLSTAMDVRSASAVIHLYHMLQHGLSAHVLAHKSLVCVHQMEELDLAWRVYSGLKSTGMEPADYPPISAWMARRVLAGISPSSGSNWQQEVWPLLFVHKWPALSTRQLAQSYWLLVSSCADCCKMTAQAFTVAAMTGTGNMRGVHSLHAC